MRFLQLLPLLLTACTAVFSQSNINISLCRQTGLLYEKHLNTGNCGTHRALQPLTNTRELETARDSVMKGAGKVKEVVRSKGRIQVSGIFDTEFNYEKNTSASNNLILEGGVSATGTYSDKLSGNLTFLSGSSSFPSQTDSLIAHSNVVPGMGLAYPSPQGHSYQYSAGYLSYSPGKVFNFQAGKDKHFWGDGYRSLFLSDVANSYPFLKISTTIWKIKYVNLYTVFKDITASPFKNDFRNKYGTFHYLSWNATRRINLSLFESIIWQGSDTNRMRNYDVNYLNPVIFYRPVEYSLGSSDNAFLGLSFKIKLGEHFNQQIYGQVILDEFLLKEVMAIFKKLAHPLDKSIKYGWWGNKQGVQLGFRSFDLFTLNNLSFQTEMNAVRPYTYSHGSVQQNYGHFNQPLAHPLGANFTESVSFLNYRYKKWTAEAEFLYAVYGKNEKGKNWGQDIFVSYTSHPLEYGNKFWQGVKTNLMYTHFKLGYFLIPSSGLVAEAGVAVRQETNALQSLSSASLLVGIRTCLMNRYRDY